MNLALTDPLRGVFFFRFGTETEPSETFNDQTQVRPRLRTWVALDLMLITAGPCFFLGPVWGSFFGLSGRVCPFLRRPGLTALANLGR
jgi:hypothetical protein